MPFLHLTDIPPQEAEKQALSLRPEAEPISDLSDVKIYLNIPAVVTGEFDRFAEAMSEIFPDRTDAPQDAATDALDFVEGLIIRMCFAVYLTFIVISFAYRKFLMRR